MPELTALFGLIAQPRLEPLGVTAVPGDAAGAGVSYTFLRHPGHREHPENLVPLTSSQADAIDAARASSSLPAEVRAKIDALRFPVLWDAVRTHHRLDHDVRHLLQGHVDSVSAEHHRRDQRLLHLVAASAWPAEERMTVVLAGVAVPAIGYPHPKLVAIGFVTGRSIVTAVLERRFAHHLTLDFDRHPLF